MLISNSPIKSCTLNPLPTQIIKLLVSNLPPHLVNIINLSLASSTVPTSFKIVQLLPILKMPTLIKMNSITIDLFPTYPTSASC